MATFQQVKSAANLEINFKGGLGDPLLVSERTTLLNLAISPQDTLIQVAFDGPVNGPADCVQSSAAGLITFNQNGLYLVDLNGFVGSLSASAVNTLVMMNVRYNGVDEKANQLGIFREIGFRQVGGTYPFQFLFEANITDTISFNVWTDSFYTGTNVIFSQMGIVAQAPAVAPALRLEVYQFYQEFS